VERLHVLPVLLQERDEEVDAKHDVAQHLILGHLDVADSDTKTEHLLELELDRRADLDELGIEGFGMGDRGWELASLGEARAEETRDLLDKGI